MRTSPPPGQRQAKIFRVCTSFSATDRVREVHVQVREQHLEEVRADQGAARGVRQGRRTHRRGMWSR